jgi:hypothetical protein
VMLHDPNHNEIEVAVEKKNGNVYFADGCGILKRFYKIFAGTWVTVVYANRQLFVYPQFTPPQRLLPPNQSAHEYINSFIRYGFNALFLSTNFCHVMVKGYPTLTLLLEVGEFIVSVFLFQCVGIILFLFNSRCFLYVIR